MDMSPVSRMATEVLLDRRVRAGWHAVTFILRRGLATRPGEAFGYSSKRIPSRDGVLAAALAEPTVPPALGPRDAEAKLRPLDIDTAMPTQLVFRPSRADAFERPASAGAPTAASASKINSRMA